MLVAWARTRWRRFRAQSQRAQLLIGGSVALVVIVLVSVALGTEEDPVPRETQTLSESQAIAAVRDCLEALPASVAVSAALSQMDRHTVAVSLAEVGDSRAGWLVQGGEADEIGVPAWYVLTDRREIRAALPEAEAIAPGPGTLLCRLP